MTVDNYLAEAAALAGPAGIMAGWMRSKAPGILTTIFALISVCLITYAIYSVIALFM